MYRKIGYTVLTLVALAGGIGVLQSADEQIVFADGTWESEIAGEWLHPEQPKDQMYLVEEEINLETNPQKVEFIQQLAETSTELNQVNIDKLAKQYIILDHDSQVTYQKLFEQIKENLQAKQEREEIARQHRLAAEKKAEAERRAAAEKAAKEKIAKENAAKALAEQKKLEREKQQKNEGSITNTEKDSKGRQATKNNEPSENQPVAEVTQQAAEVKVVEATTNTITIQGLTIPLVDTQGSGSAPVGDLAGLWQGNGDTQDNLTTHIIGHNPGIFNCVLNLQMGSVISVTDYQGNSRSYTVYSILNVNDNGLDEQNQDLWNDIINQSGESISLQTCIDDFWNRMVLAR